MSDYGKEVIIDLYECNTEMFTRRNLRKYFKELCKVIDMVREDLYFWDDQGVPKCECETEPHLVGVSAVQFIRTSNITLHSLTLLKRVYINIFSCKDFDEQDAIDFTVKYFNGKIKQCKTLRRI